MHSMLYLYITQLIWTKYFLISLYQVRPLIHSLETFGKLQLLCIDGLIRSDHPNLSKRLQHNIHKYSFPTTRRKLFLFWHFVHIFVCFNSPEVLVHRLEEEFVVRLVQDLFKIQQSDFLSRYGNLHQVRRLLFVNVINYFSLRHVSWLKSTFPLFYESMEEAAAILLMLASAPEKKGVEESRL